MNGKSYGNLYKSIMKSLKTAQHYLDWANEARDNGDTELAKFFAARGMQELEKDFVDTHNMFRRLAEKEKVSSDAVDGCLWKETHQEMQHWKQKICKGLESF